MNQGEVRKLTSAAVSRPTVRSSHGGASGVAGPGYAGYRIGREEGRPGPCPHSIVRSFRFIYYRMSFGRLYRCTE